MATFAVVGFMTAVAFAAHPHFVGQSTFTVTSTGALEAAGSIAGLGNQDITVLLTATGQRTCTNRGNNVPPGQTQTVSGSVSDIRPENGRANFDVTTSSVPNTCPDRMASTVTFSIWGETKSGIPNMVILGQREGRCPLERTDRRPARR